jgi:hypothetical protein
MAAGWVWYGMIGELIEMENDGYIAAGKLK